MGGAGLRRDGPDGPQRGIAVREYPTAEGPADYLLYGDKKVLGTIEAKKDGEPLLGVETQSDATPPGSPRRRLRRRSRPISFHYESTGKETVFANRLDPYHAPRPIFAFHRPETLVEIAKRGETLRQKLRQMPPLNEDGLRQNQVRAIEGLEQSFARNRLKALTPQIMGSGKTILAVAEMARLPLRASDSGCDLHQLPRCQTAEALSPRRASMLQLRDGLPASTRLSRPLVRAARRCP